jgi:hypothetical protein
VAPTSVVAKAVLEKYTWHTATLYWYHLVYCTAVTVPQGRIYSVAPTSDPRPGLPRWTQPSLTVLREEEALKQYGPRQVFNQTQALVLLLQAATWKVRTWQTFAQRLARKPCSVCYISLLVLGGIGPQ